MSPIAKKKTFNINTKTQTAKKKTNHHFTTFIIIIIIQSIAYTYKRVKRFLN